MKGWQNSVKSLRIYNKDISSLCENVIRELVNYLEASAGGIFLLNTVNEESIFEMIATFAFDRKKYLQKIIRLERDL